MRLSLLPAALLLAVVSFFSSCKISAPTFTGINNIKFERIGGNGLKLGAEAAFHNPNKLRFRITHVELNLVLNDKLIGFLGEKADIPVEKPTDFIIPLGITVKPEGTILENIKTLYGYLTDKEIELYFVGSVRAKAMGFKFNIPIKYRQKVKRSNFK